MTRKIISLITLVFICFTAKALSQDGCKPPEIVFNKAAFNLFTPAQEMELGDVIAQLIEKDFYVITDAEANRKVREIGEKLVKHLPPTDIKFQFFVIDAPTVNAFNTAGGRIYVTRKLIAFARNEDELAGVIGHELGHGIVRHVSTDISRSFKEILGIEKVGDKKDIFAKYNELINKRRTKRLKIKDNHGDNQQMEADSIGLHALVAAGYDPQNYATAYDRLVEAKGKTGNAFSDFFGATSPEQKRLREMLSAVSSLPANCRDKKDVRAIEDFDQWQSFVVTTSTFQKEEKLTAVTAKGSLNPYLRGELTNIRYSPDGKYIIAQDSSGINVLKSDPFSYHFRIEATGAKPATFTPDSKHLVFQTQGFRIEKWNVEDKRSAQVKEIYKRGGCLQSALSPDGKYVVCFTVRSALENTLELINVETSEVILKKDNFYRPGFIELFEWQLNTIIGGTIDSFAFEFSPSGKYFVTSRVAKLNPSGGSAESQRYTWETIAYRQEMAFAYDLEARKEVKMGGSLKDVMSLPFAFYDEDTIVAQSYTKEGKAGTFSFPGGQQKEKFYINGNSFTFPGKGPYFVIRPMPSSPVGVYEFKTQKFVVANRLAALDVYDDKLISEKKSGELAVYKLEGADNAPKQIGSLLMPKSPFGSLRTISLSPDLSWMALSERSRGGVWNLKTGERPIYIRGFSGSFIDEDQNVYADFPRYEQQPRTVTLLNPSRMTMAALDPISKPAARQFGKFLVRMKTREETRQEQGQSEGKSSRVEQRTGETRGPNLSVGNGITVSSSSFSTSVDYIESTIDVSDVRTSKLMWSKTFPQERPAYRFDGRNETAVFYWRLTTKAAKEMIAADPALAQKAKAMGEKDSDYLVQTVNANTGEKLGEVLIETGEGSFSIDNVFACGDWLTVIDSQNRVLLYSISQGELRWNFFGDNVAINPLKSIAAVENGAGQISIYDLNTGDAIDQLRFPASVATLAFSKDGKTMFALTAEQNYYLFDAAALSRR